MVWLLVQGDKDFGLDADLSHWLGSKEARARGRGFRATDSDYDNRAVPDKMWQAAASTSDMPSLLPQPLWNCDQAFRDLVERLEPGVHEFVPIPIYDKRITRVVGQRYLLRVCQKALTIDPYRSNSEAIIQVEAMPLSECFIIAISGLRLLGFQSTVGLALNDNFSSSFHIWRESVIDTYEQIFISDEMKCEMENIDLFDDCYLNLFPTQA